MTGEELRAVRDELGMTQAELAHRMGSSQFALSRMENDRYPIGTLTRARLSLVRVGELLKDSPTDKGKRVLELVEEGLR